MMIVAERSGLVPALTKFVREKPVWVRMGRRRCRIASVERFVGIVVCDDGLFD